MANKQSTKRARARLNLTDDLARLPRLETNPGFLAATARRAELEQRARAFRQALSDAQLVEDQAKAAADAADFKLRAGRGKQADVDAANKQFEAARGERAKLHYSLFDTEQELAGLDAVAVERRARLETLAQLLPAYKQALATLATALEQAAEANLDVHALALALNAAVPYPDENIGPKSRSRFDSDSEFDRALRRDHMRRDLYGIARAENLALRELLPGAGSQQTRLDLVLVAADATIAQLDTKLAAVRAQLADLNAAA